MRYCMKDKTKRLRFNWYKLLYSTGDKVLIDMFWEHYKKHRISKNRSARCVLIHYYCTTSTPVPHQVAEVFFFNRDMRIVNFKIPWDDPVKLEEML